MKKRYGVTKNGGLSLPLGNPSPPFSRGGGLGALPWQALLQGSRKGANGFFRSSFGRGPGPNHQGPHHIRGVCPPFPSLLEEGFFFSLLFGGVRRPGRKMGTLYPSFFFSFLGPSGFFSPLFFEGGEQSIEYHSSGNLFYFFFFFFFLLFKQPETMGTKAGKVPGFFLFFRPSVSSANKGVYGKGKGFDGLSGL